MTGYDDPALLADRILAAPGPRLIAFDCDGVLAPIVAHANEAALFDGTGALIHRLVGLADTSVAVVSGRSLDGLAQFGFGDDVIVVGSHGAERRNADMTPLTDAECLRLAALTAVLEVARDTAGDGAWIEHKPASVVLHVRQADDDRGDEALIRAERDAASVDGAVAVPGAKVLELLARPTDKGSAVESLRNEIGATSVVYVGDDVTDEHALEGLGGTDIGIKVGDARTAASHRLADPAAVRTMLERLVAHID